MTLVQTESIPLSVDELRQCVFCRSGATEVPCVCAGVSAPWNTVADNMDRRPNSSALHRQQPAYSVIRGGLCDPLSARIERTQLHYTPAKKPALTVGTSTVSVVIPSRRFLSRSHRSIPSIRSMAGAPSRTASRSASLVNLPVVINRLLSALATIAPRKSCTSGAPTDPECLLHWNRTWNERGLTRKTPAPSIPPSPERPLTSTLVNPDSRCGACSVSVCSANGKRQAPCLLQVRSLWQRRSTASASIDLRTSRRSSSRHAFSSRHHHQPW